ncbi:MAG: hypothetical protein MZV70_50865 [Desulfobacterales bacterium]|nr:hypothetical protein [Desulfobacterales bacterium]
MTVITQPQALHLTFAVSDLHPGFVDPVTLAAGIAGDIDHQGAPVLRFRLG